MTGWSEGGPWALAAATCLDPARLVHVTSVAGGSYGALGANGAAKELSTADALGCTNSGPFDVTTIRRPVHLWQGTADTLAPEAVNKPIGSQMPGAVWHEVADGGHFIAVSHAAEILAIAARELGKT